MDSTDLNDVGRELLRAVNAPTTPAVNEAGKSARRRSLLLSLDEELDTELVLGAFAAVLNPCGYAEHIGMAPIPTRRGSGRFK